MAKRWGSRSVAQFLRIFFMSCFLCTTMMWCFKTHTHSATPSRTHPCTQLVYGSELAYTRVYWMLIKGICGKKKLGPCYF